MLLAISFKIFLFLGFTPPLLLIVMEKRVPRQCLKRRQPSLTVMFLSPKRFISPLFSFIFFLKEELRFCIDLYIHLCWHLINVITSRSLRATASNVGEYLKRNGKGLFFLFWIRIEFPSSGRASDYEVALYQNWLCIDGNSFRRAPVIPDGKIPKLY